MCILRERAAWSGLVARMAGFVIIASAVMISPFSIASDGSTGKARNLASACAMCHGPNGVSAGGIPSLAGQSREYLETQLLDFRSGKRPASIMHQIARGYSDRELAILATYFSAQRPAQAEVTGATRGTP